MNTKSELRCVAATDGTSYKTKTLDIDDKTTHQVERTDLTTQVSQTLTLDAAKTHTLALDGTDLGVIRQILVKAAGPVQVNLLDNTAAVNELTSFELGGAAGTGACTLFAEVKGFDIAAGDTFTIVNNGASPVIVTYALWGDSVAD